MPTSQMLSFLFTDIEGSTSLLTRVGSDAYAAVLANHHRLVRDCLSRFDGREIGAPQGDGFFAAFGSARNCVAGAIDLQRSLAAHSWPGGQQPWVRMGVHCGEVTAVGTGLVGLEVHRAARIAAVAFGGQDLCSGSVVAIVDASPPEGVVFRDLGLHRLKDLSSPERIYQVVAPGLRDAFPPLRSLDGSRHNLPLQWSTFVGRHDDVVTAARRLEDTRIVTLVGPGGVGKTRLALQIAAEVVDRYPGGVWLVELAPLGTGDRIETAVVSALHLRDDPLRPRFETLADHLDREPTLLVLDNCEHVLDAAAALVGGLLQRCGNLSVLATSIEALRVPGEVRQAVAPLPTLEGDGMGAVPSGVGPAVELFVDRACATDPAFAADAPTLAAVTRLCRRLDGLPLAIELAAARVNMLAPEQIEARLDDRFGLLTTGLRTAETRHRTLRAVVEWSVQLLSSEERGVLERLSVFRGGATLEAIEAVAGDGEVPQSGVLDNVAGLVDRSLLMVRGSGARRRYELLETIRAYATEQLADSGEETARDRHLNWLADFVATRTISAAGTDQLGRFADLNEELDNLRTGLQWSTSSPVRATVGLQIASQLGEFWMARGLRWEGIEWVGRLVRLSGADPRIRVEALYTAACLAAISWPTAAVPLIDAADELTGDDATGRALAALAHAAFAIFSGHTAEAGRYLIEAKTLADGTLPEDAAAMATIFEAMVRFLFDVPDGVRELDSLTADPAIDDHMRGCMKLYTALGHHVLDHHDEAALAFDAAWSSPDVTTCPSCRSLALSVRTLVAQRSTAERAADIVEALRLSDGINEVMTQVEALQALAVLAGELRRPDLVAKLDGGTESLRRQSGYGLELPGLKSGVAEAAREARAVLGQDEYEEQRAAGASMAYATLSLLAADVTALRTDRAERT